MALLVIGTLMNVAGIVLGSSRDLTFLGKGVANRVRGVPAAFVACVRSLWRRLRAGSLPARTYSGSGGVTATASVSGSGFHWSDLPDGLSPVQAIDRLRSRTDSLLEKLTAEAKSRSEVVERLSGEAVRFRETVEVRLAGLEHRIDDFDVKPAGQRAVGAVLVICGTSIILVGALLAR